MREEEWGKVGERGEREGEEEKRGGSFKGREGEGSG
jgi:hypothetical protein